MFIERFWDFKRFCWLLLLVYCMWFFSSLFSLNTAGKAEWPPGAEASPTPIPLSWAPNHAPDWEGGTHKLWQYVHPTPKGGLGLHTWLFCSYDIRTQILPAGGGPQLLMSNQCCGWACVRLWKLVETLVEWDLTQRPHSAFYRFFFFFNE